MISKYPAAVNAAIGGVVSIVAGILIRHGLINGLSQEEKDTITLTIVGVAQAVAGWATHRKVSPVAKEN